MVVTRPSRPARALLTGAVTAAVLLAGCSSPGGDAPARTDAAAPASTTSPAPTAPGSTSTGPTNGATSSPAGATPATTSPAPTSTTRATPTATRRSTPPRPTLRVTASATPEYGAPVAVIASPSGNVICDFARDDSTAGCGVLSLIDPDNGAKWWIEIGGSRAERVFREDAPWSGNRDGSVQVVEYGTTVTTGRYTCTSEKSGMTCWNERTGVGAHLSRAGIDVLSRKG